MLVLLFTSMSLYSMRYIPLCAIVYAPILSKHGDILIQESGGSLKVAQRTFQGIRKDRCLRKRVCHSPGRTGRFCRLAAGKIPVRFPEKTTPRAAIDFLRANPIRGSMFNNDEIGDHVIYNLYPQYKVFVDGRLDMYGTRILREYDKVISLQPGWRDVLVKYDINFVFDYTDSLLSRILSSDVEWRQIYTDNVASIFLRNTPENEEVIARYLDGGRGLAQGH